MKRVLTIILSIWAAGAAADHGTETGANAAGQSWVDNFKGQIALCLNMGQQSDGSIAYTAVAFEMTPDARPVESSIRLARPSAQAGEAQGFEAARRAILRCGQPHYNLPSTLFSQWQFVEINFPYYVPSN